MNHKTEHPKEEILKLLGNEFRKDRNILFAIVHGSFVAGNNYNDIDIALFLSQETASPLNYELDLETDFIIRHRLTHSVDIRVLNNAPLSFAFNVIKNGTLLFTSDEERYCDYKEDIIRRYLDFSFRRKSMLKESLRCACK
ncbi:MAG TPA: nucleotidyltransferase domain-containing protein [Spirochaetota bacterium]|nr:nucleotidyltransferase domain-containing protein [Spirochaetota bacterium]HQP48524.1 nucleotidyltransferase domain-containing protein [Spirochaetota bacterium]